MTEPHLTDLGLSRYFDSGDGGCATRPDTHHHRAVAESGWDNTARFGDDATMVVPVDLNAQLFRYEVNLADFCAELGRNRDAAKISGPGRGTARTHWSTPVGSRRGFLL
jgi:hypothetical protein